MNSTTQHRSPERMKRFKEMVAEDARKVAAEWREMGIEDAPAMLAIAKEATRNEEPLPEPAEQAKGQLRAYMHSQEIGAAWAEMLRRLGIEFRL